MITVECTSNSISVNSANIILLELRVPLMQSIAEHRSAKDTSLGLIYDAAREFVIVIQR